MGEAEWESYLETAGLGLEDAERAYPILHEYGDGLGCRYNEKDSIEITILFLPDPMITPSTNSSQAVKLNPSVLCLYKIYL